MEPLPYPHLSANTLVRPRRRVWGVVAVAALLLAGCSKDSHDTETSRTSSSVAAPETTVLPPRSVTTETTALPQDCSIWWTVYPGERLNSAETEMIQQHVDLLRQLQDPNESIAGGDILTAGSVLRSARRDPLYADAMTRAKQMIESGQQVDATDVLSFSVTEPRLCDPNFMHQDDTDAHQQRFTSLGRFVVTGVGGKLGGETSQLLQRGYEGLKTLYGDIEREIVESA